MTELERRATLAVFASILPDAGRRQLLPHYERLLASMTHLRALGVRASFLFAALLLPLLVLSRPRTLMSASGDEREECMTRLLRSPIYLVRQIALLLKALTCLVYFQDSGVRSAHGLGPVGHTP